MATPIRVPRPQTFTSSLGQSQETENAIVEIHTDENITGIGEICSIWGPKRPRVRPKTSTICLRGHLRAVIPSALQKFTP